MGKYHYSFREELPDGTSVYRIRAERDIPLNGVQKGDLGGFIESEANLSQDGDAWVHEKAYVLGNALVKGDALVTGNAWVTGEAVVDGNSKIDQNAIIAENAHVTNVKIMGQDVKIQGNAKVDSVFISGDDIRIEGKAQVQDGILAGIDIRIKDDARLKRFRINGGSVKIQISGNACIENDETLLDIKGTDIFIGGHAEVKDCQSISGSFIRIEEDTSLKDGIQVNGNHILFTGATFIEGDVQIGDETEVRDCVQISNDSQQVFSIRDVILHGDVFIDGTQFKGVF